MNFKNILVPIDGSSCSNRALDAAITLAKKTNGSITAIYVLPFPAFQIYQPDKVIKEKLYSEAKKLLKSAEQNALKKEVKLQYKILQGLVGDVIVDFSNSRKNKTDVILIGHRGRSKIKEALIGSVANYVVHKSKVPVMVVK